jgi:hypothetical protein
MDPVSVATAASTAARLRRWGVAVQKTTTAAAALAAILTGVAGALSVLVRNGNSFGSWPLWAAVSAGVLGVGGSLVGFINFQRRGLRARVDEQIRTSVEAGDASVAEVARRVGAENDELVQQLAQRYLVDDSPVRREVEAAMFEFLPPLPRSAKRLLNHLRLQLALAVQHGILDADSPVTPTHLAKWIVLNERWPDLALAVGADPALLTQLESVEREQALALLLRRHNLNAPVSPDLFEFLREETRLSEVVDRLVHLETAAA